MTREDIEEYAKMWDEEIYMFDNPSFDNSIIGISDDHRVVYGFEKMVDEFAEANDCDATEAMEFIEYNTLNSLGFSGAPIVVYEVV